MSYQDLLEDIRWLNKRYFILKRDHFKCTVCGSKYRLQVHHTYYDGHINPWDYPDESLITLCSKCHRHYHETHEITIKQDIAAYTDKKTPHLKNKKKPFGKKKKSEKRKKKKRNGLSLSDLQEKNGLRIKPRQSR